MLPTMLAAISLLAGAAVPVQTITDPILVPDDGPLLGNGDLSVSVYQVRNQLVFRLGKGDVWDRRFDPSDDPKPPHIDEIAHGIRDEGWKCPPYGDTPPVALRGTTNPQRMKELCQGAPPSYNRRPYPCPKPVGEVALHLPPDPPGLRIRYELSLADAVLHIACTWTTGLKVDVTAFVPPTANTLVLRWQCNEWSAASRQGNRPPLRLSVYRWADPSVQEFGDRYDAEARHGAFLAMADPKATPLAPPSLIRLDGRPVIDQAFAHEPTFPNGFRCLVAPFAAEGWTVAPLTQPASREARIELASAPDRLDGWAAVAVATSSDAGGPEAEIARQAAACPPGAAARLTEIETATKAASAAFWARSSLELDDPRLTRLWYETLHARRCVNAPGKLPPGLFLPSTLRDYSHWHGDWHTNYNYQQPFWGDLTSNHVELYDAYFVGLEYFRQVGRLIAQRYYNARGTFIQLSNYPIQAVDDTLGAVPMGRMAYMTGWVAGDVWQRYLATQDREWLARVGYPALRDCALFYLDVLKRGEDGRYHLFPSNEGEGGFTGDPKDYTDRGQVMRNLRYGLRCAVWAAEALGADAELKAQWQDRLDHCAGDNGTALDQRTGVAKWFFEHNAAEFGDGRPFRGQAKGDDVRPWPLPGEWTDEWYPGQYPLIAVPAMHNADIDPRRVYAGYQRLVERWRGPNGLVRAMAASMYGYDGAWTETLGIHAPLQEMLLQSYGGALRLFPVWPLGHDARFQDFRAEGAFLVSAAVHAGVIGDVTVRSERGGACRLFPPWPSGVSVTRDGQAVPVTTAEGMAAFETVAGGVYVVRPAG